MQVILVMVSSANGKITRGNNSDIYSWTSKEDKTLFFSLIEKHNLIVMGRKTYEAAKDHIVLSPDTLRIVLTRNADIYKKDHIPGQLEFSSETPYDLLKRLKKKGYKKMLLVGGGEINALFLKEHLVNEIHLTIEPYLFGAGQPLIAQSDIVYSLRLRQIKQLNKQGTLHLIYHVK